MGLRSECIWPKLAILAAKIITRDANICRGCGNRFESSQLHVHHLVPFRNFEDPAIANQASNLVSLCPACHRKAELSVMIRSGLAASAYALRSMAPLLIMCDREDISLITENRSILNDGNPAVWYMTTSQVDWAFQKTFRSAKAVDKTCHRNNSGLRL